MVRIMKKTGKVLFGLSGIIYMLYLAAAVYLNITFPDKIYSGNARTGYSDFFNTAVSDSRTVFGGYTDFLPSHSSADSVIAVRNTDRPYLVPCGTPFGIKLLTDGVVVTGFGKVGDSPDVFELSPAGRAGIEKGDIIREVNGKKVNSARHLTELITKACENGSTAAQIGFLRGDDMLYADIFPQTDTDGVAKIGVWVRDSTAGIGTMTFYDKSRQIFGGLGHAVCDIDTGNILPLGNGEIVPAVISSVIKGKQGAPGELCGAFIGSTPSGQIQQNSACGLYGNSSFCPVSSDEMPMAFSREVKTGKAYILSTVDDNPAQRFEISIDSINYNDSENKNMVISVTDKRLIEAAGGIVQGMSGSPIIQDGMLVGAVTHVMVNDPLRGYAIFSETMYNKSLEINTADIVENAA